MFLAQGFVATFDFGPRDRPSFSRWFKHSNFVHIRDAIAKMQKQEPLPSKRAGSAVIQCASNENTLLLGGFAGPVHFYLTGAHLPFLSRDGANALDCFTRDCETRETGLEGALRCSELTRGEEGDNSCMEVGPKDVRPKKCVSSAPLRCSSPFLPLSVQYL